MNDISNIIKYHKVLIYNMHIVEPIINTLFLLLTQKCVLLTSSQHARYKLNQCNILSYILHIQENII